MTPDIWRMTMPDLKPCPFCGGKAELFHSYDGYHCVQCTCCACGTIHMRTEMDVVRMWNRRAGERKEGDDNR